MTLPDDPNKQPTRSDRSASKRPSVFISYAHETDDHKKKVYSLAASLRRDGFEILIDIEKTSGEDWPLWMQRQLQKADFVLCVCTAEYLARFDHEAPANVGLGVGWEGGLIRRMLYEVKLENSRVCPMYFSQADSQYVPISLSGYDGFLLADNNGYLQLLRKLTSRPEYLLPKDTDGGAIVLETVTVEPLFPAIAKNGNAVKNLIAAIEFTLDQPMDDFDEREFLQAFSIATGIRPSQVRIASIRQGSTIVRLEGDPETITEAVTQLTNSVAALRELSRATKLVRLEWSIDGDTEVLSCEFQHPVADKRRFRIALSFPGPHRPFVERVAENLLNAVSKDGILFDKWHRAEFARPRLNVYLPELYRTQSDLIVVFLGSDYARARWCGLEWRAVMDIIQNADDARIMLLRFDDGKVPGVYDGDGYIDIKNLQPEDVASEILQRLSINKGDTSRIDVSEDDQSSKIGGATNLEKATPTPDNDSLSELIAELEGQVRRLDEDVFIEAWNLLKLGVVDGGDPRKTFTKEILGDLSPKKTVNCLRGAVANTGVKTNEDVVTQIIRRLIPIKYGSQLTQIMFQKNKSGTFRFVEGVVGHQLSAEVMVARYDCRPLHIESDGKPQYAFGTVSIPNPGGGPTRLNAGAVAFLGDLLASLGGRFFGAAVAPTGDNVNVLARQLEGLVRNLAEEHSDTTTGQKVTVHVLVTLPKSATERKAAREVIEFVSPKVESLLFVELSPQPDSGDIEVNIFQCVLRKASV